MKKLIILLYLFANSISYSYADSSDDNYWAGINAVDIEFGSIYQYHNMCQELPVNILRYIVNKVYREYNLTDANGEYFLDGLQQSDGFYLGSELVKADGCIKAAENKNGLNNTFNLTTGKSRKILDYAKILNNYFPDAKIKIKGRDKKRPKRGTLSISKARKLINFNPKFNLERGAKIYIDFYKKFIESKT